MRLLLVLSVIKLSPKYVTISSISALLVLIRGLISTPLLSFIPVRPVIPLPLERFIRKVSATSFKLWATAILSALYRSLISSNTLYLRTRPASSSEILFSLAKSGTSRRLISSLISSLLHSFNTKSSSLAASSPLIP